MSTTIDRNTRAAKRSSRARSASAGGVRYGPFEYLGALTRSYHGWGFVLSLVALPLVGLAYWIDDRFVLPAFCVGGVGGLVFAAYVSWRYDQARDAMARIARERADASDLVTARECRACRALLPVDEVTCTACGAPLT